MTYLWLDALHPTTTKSVAKVRTVRLLNADAAVRGGDEAVRDDLAVRDNAAFLKLKTTEHGEQKAVIQWWKFAHKSYRLPEIALYAVPNASKRTPKMASWMKSEGLRKGMLDLNLDAPAGGFHGLRIELKLKPNTVSPEQQAAISYYTDAGYCAAVCWSGGEAIDCIKWYLARTL